MNNIIVHFVGELFTSPKNKALFSIDLLIYVVGNNWNSRPVQQMEMSGLRLLENLIHSHCLFLDQCYIWMYLNCLCYGISTLELGDAI